MTDDTITQDDLDRLEEQEKALVFDRFGYDDAWAIGSWIVEAARDRELGIVVDIRRGAQQLFHAARPGTSPDNDSWVERKVRSTLRFGMSSYRLGRSCALHFGDFNEATHLPYDQYVASGGCFPVTIRDSGIIGTITVSGLAEKADHELVVEAIRHHLGLGGPSADG